MVESEPTFAHDMALAKRLLEALVQKLDTAETALCRSLSCTPTELQAAFESLSQLGVPVQCDPHTGYHVHRVPELLDTAVISAGLNSLTSQALVRIDHLWATDSTNQRLLERWAEPQGAHGHVLLAEYQHNGRGRHGRTWIAPLASGLCLSLGWRLPQQLTGHLGTLAIAVGVAGMRLLQDLGIAKATLKWPNDLLVVGRKVGGILIENRISGKSCGTVIGIGLNINLPQEAYTAIDQAFTDLACLLDVVPSRSAIAAKLLNHLVAVLQTLQVQGPEALLSEWRSHDALIGKTVLLRAGDQQWEGTVRGIAVDGALLLEHNGKLERFNFGELSLREVT